MPLAADRRRRPIDVQMPSEHLTQERRSRRRRAAALTEVCDHVRAVVGADGAGSIVVAGGGERVGDALVALGVAPVRRNVIAPALRRDHPVANTAVVAARP